MRTMNSQLRELPGTSTEVLPDRYFVPVCLYPHTRYRTREGLTDLIEQFALDRCEHMIVVADFLLALDNLVTGRFWNPEMVFDKAHRQGTEIFRLIRRTARRQNSEDRMSLNYWDDVSVTEDFKAFSSRLTSACLACESFGATVDRFVRSRIDRYAQGEAGERQYNAETRYILGEISMSVYCTEILGYRSEIWEKPLAPDAPDPLGILYSRHPEIVLSVSGKERLDRRLEFLYPA